MPEFVADGEIAGIAKTAVIARIEKQKQTVFAAIHVDRILRQGFF
ncbi:MAG TPA: hypothetical protein VI636_20845 [Candidatus Angelobacter sp.]